MDIFNQSIPYGVNTLFSEENISEYFQNFQWIPPACCNVTLGTANDNTNHLNDAIKKELAFAEKLLYESCINPSLLWAHSDEILGSDAPNYANFNLEESLPYCPRNRALDLSSTDVETLSNDWNGLNELNEMPEVFAGTFGPETQSIVMDQNMLGQNLDPEFRSESESRFLHEELWNNMSEMYKSSSEICIEESGFQSCQRRGEHSNIPGIQTSKTISKPGKSKDYNRGKPLSMDLREMILLLYLEGLRTSKIARSVGVSHSCVSKIIQRFCTTGSLYPSNSKKCPVKRFR